MTFGVPTQSLRVMQQSPSRDAPGIMPPGVVIVQAYNKEPPDSIKAWVHSVALNALYAKRHNYSHRLYIYENRNDPLTVGACYDEFGEPQGSHWCKVIALSDAMTDFPNADTFVWLDTDAAIRKMGMSLPEFMQSSNIKVEQNCDHAGSIPKEHYNIWSWVNVQKWGCSATTFGLIFQRSEVTDRIFSKWLSMRGANQQHDQPSFAALYEKYPKDIAVSVDQAMSDNPNQFLHHRCGSCKWLPNVSDMMVKISAENNIGMDAISSVLKGLDVKHMDAKTMESRFSFWRSVTKKDMLDH